MFVFFYLLIAHSEVYRLFASFPTPFCHFRCSVFFCCYYYTYILLWWFNNTNKKEQRAKVDGMVGFSFNLMVVGYRGKIRLLAWIFNLYRKLNFYTIGTIGIIIGILQTELNYFEHWKSVFFREDLHSNWDLIASIEWVLFLFFTHSLMNGISLIIRFYALLIRSCSVLVHHV